MLYCLIPSRRGLGRLAFGLVVAAAGLAGTARAAPPQVLATIRPLQSLAAMVMQGVGTPGLLIKSAASPHSYTIRPSDARALNSADIVLWTGPAMETFLARTLPTLKKSTQVVAAQNLPGVTLLAPRRLDGDTPADDDDKDDAGPGHAVADWDAHLWLSPDNAVAIVRGLAALLSQADPADAARYAANAQTAAAMLGRLKDEVAATLAGLPATGYIAGHDAYQYFDHAFHLRFMGAALTHPGRPPSARHIVNLNKAIATGNVTCLATEPDDLEPLFDRLAEAHKMRLVQADNLGIDLKTGPTLYPEMLRGLAKSFRACLGG